MAFLKELSNIVTLDFDTETQWDIKFDGGLEGGYQCPAPFNTWVPATEFDLNEFEVNDFTFDAGNVKKLSIPHEKAVGTISLTFNDAYNIMTKYMEDWYRLIYPKDGVVACILDPGVLRLLSVQYLHIDRNVYQEDTYVVRPYSRFSKRRSSNDNLITFKVDFRIHGKLK